MCLDRRLGDLRLFVWIVFILQKLYSVCWPPKAHFGVTRVSEALQRLTAWVCIYLIASVLRMERSARETFLLSPKAVDLCVCDIAEWGAARSPTRA